MHHHKTAYRATSLILDQHSLIHEGQLSMILPLSL